MDKPRLIMEQLKPLSPKKTPVAFPSTFSLGSKHLGAKPEAFIRQLRQRTQGLSTGIKEVDRHLLGLRGLVGILGEPKCCKSTLVWQVALLNACQGIPTLVLDRENGKDRCTRRLLAQHFKVPLLQLADLPDQRLTEMLTFLAGLPLFISNEASSFEQVEEDVEALFAEGKEALLIVDSLHSMPQKLEEMRSSIDDWLIRLDSLKLRYGGRLTILMTVEKPRIAYGMASRAGGKESGRIEYKLEQQLDLRLSDSGDGIIMECTLNRDGAAGWQVELQKVFKDDCDPNSFLFQLTSREVEL